MAAISIIEGYGDDEEVEDEFDPYATNIECEGCGECISFEEDVVLMQVTCPELLDGRIQFLAFLDDTGEPVYPPVHLHIGCYESLAEELSRIIQDIPPLEEAGQPFHCDYCKSTTRAGELCVGIDVGEVTLSKKRQIPYFQPAVHNQTMTMCLVCAVRLAVDETGIEIWESLGQAEECPICTIDRCWRRGPGGCGCECHHKHG